MLKEVNPTLVKPENISLAGFLTPPFFSCKVIVYFAKKAESFNSPVGGISESRPPKVPYPPDKQGYAGFRDLLTADR